MSKLKDADEIEAYFIMLNIFNNTRNEWLNEWIYLFMAVQKSTHFSIFG